MGTPSGTWLNPGERMLLEETDVALWEYRRNRKGTEEIELAKSPLLIVTDSRVVFLKQGQLIYELIYSLPYLRSFLPKLKEQNDQAAMQSAVQPKPRVQVRWGRNAANLNALPGRDYVNILTAAEHPRKLFGPAHYALMTEVTFRPVTMERVANLEQQQEESSGRLHKLGLKIQEEQLDWVIQWRTVHLKVKAKEQIDRLVGTLAPALPEMQEYVSQPNGLQTDYAIPAQQMQGLSGYRPEEGS